MPRSVSHELHGNLEGLRIRFWERHTEGTMHAIVNGVHTYECPAGNEHAVAIETRWDIPDKAERWHELATRARDHDEQAATELATRMVRETIDEAWDDPCG